ncbi:NAD(P)-binding protein [Dendrothele bispora CBS 962.96]|uniref:NAD(P)-binding protein n=1 Tax=Dendrothele bispora (strain CBS 962.96) TaxID=1314807 RepID=A0A4S8M3R5_DENBC|nr:NAD(P)-binding protein [Dendrothele bispora CBS 962.96]
MSIKGTTLKTSLKPLLVVGGVGNGTGTGAATAKLFARRGYDVSLIARGSDALHRLSEEINKEGRGKATPFPTASYRPNDIHAAFTSLSKFYGLPSSPLPSSSSSSLIKNQTHILRVALFNIAYPIFKPFLETSDEDVQKSLEGNVQSAFTFSREVLLRLLENEDVDINSTLSRVNDSDDVSTNKILGGKGTLIFTGATASQRGNTMTSAFAAAKAGNRMLSQSLAKEFGKEGVHVVHGIKTSTDAGFVRLQPESIAQVYWNVAHQDRSAWTWELDLRPADEQW